MTVTETRTVANPPSETDSISSPESSSTWANLRPSCWYSATLYDGNRLFQRSGPCKSLSCPECGPIRREQAYEEAVLRHSLEPEIWVVYVKAEMVDRLRKQAGRAEQPIESVPVSKHWNVVISPHRFDGAVQLDPDEMRRLFLKYRTTKRQHRKSGRWAPKKPVKKIAGPAPVTISRGYVSPQAFEDVAKALGARVWYSGTTTRWINDMWGLGAEWFKKVLVEHEHHLRKRRRAIYAPQPS